MTTPMTRTALALIATGAALAVAATSVAPIEAATAPVETGRFVWHDLMTRDVIAAKRFYGDLFGWKFEDTKRGDRPYVLARIGSEPVAGFVDITANATAGQQWLSFMAVTDVDATATQVQAAGGKILVQPRELDALARVDVVTDPQGAPLGIARLQRDRPDPTQPTANHFFWDEYLARDAAQALTFYKSVAGYTSTISDSRLGIEYHVLRNSRGRAGLFQLPATAADVEPNWLPYVMVSDPVALAARVTALGGRILRPAAPERRNNTLVIIADPGGAPLALQKYPY